MHVKRVPRTVKPPSGKQRPVSSNFPTVNLLLWLAMYLQEARMQSETSSVPKETPYPICEILLMTGTQCCHMQQKMYMRKS